MTAAAALPTRHEPPAIRDGAIARPALADRLRSAPVATIVAPAGYGKTTLLAEVTAAGDLPVAWISLQGDEDPPAFLRRVTVAVGWAQGLDEPPTTTAKLRAALRKGPPVRIVLDDLHARHPEQSLDLVYALAADLPPPGQLLLASRTPIAPEGPARL